MTPKELRQRIAEYVDSLPEVKRRKFLDNLLARISHLDLLQISKMIDGIEEKVRLEVLNG